MEYLMDAYAGNCKNGSRRKKVFKGKGKEQFSCFKLTNMGIWFVDDRDE
jgi:hypothetical protein